MNAFENLLVDNKLANFQYSTLSQYSTTFNIQEVSTFDNFQDSTLKIQQLSTFNFDNLVSNMQF